MAEEEGNEFRWSMFREEACTIFAGVAIAVPILHESLGWESRLGVAVLLSVFLIFLSVVDIRYGMLYDKVVFPMGCAGLMLDFLGLAVEPADGLVAACAGGGTLLFVRWASRGGMGGGDVKLGFALGLWLGLEGTVLALFLAFLSGAAVGVSRMLWEKRRDQRMAFGPFLAFGAWMAFLYGESIFQHYVAWAWR